MIPPLTNRTPAMKKLLLLLRRACAWARLFAHDVEVDAILVEVAIATDPGSLAYLLRKLVKARGKRGLARADYQATLPPGERLTWIDA